MHEKTEVEKWEKIHTIIHVGVLGTVGFTYAIDHVAMVVTVAVNLVESIFAIIKDFS